MFKSRPHILQVDKLRPHSCNGERTLQSAKQSVTPTGPTCQLRCMIHILSTPVHIALLRAAAPEPSPKTLTPPIKPKPPPSPLSHRQPGTTVSAKRTPSFRKAHPIYTLHPLCLWPPTKPYPTPLPKPSHRRLPRSAHLRERASGLHLSPSPGRRTSRAQRICSGPRGDPSAPAPPPAVTRPPSRSPETPPPPPPPPPPWPLPRPRRVR